jgi:hypothetical protein
LRALFFLHNGYDAGYNPDKIFESLASANNIMKKMAAKPRAKTSSKNVTFSLLTNAPNRVKTCVQASMFAIFYAVLIRLRSILLNDFIW